MTNTQRLSRIYLNVQDQYGVNDGEKSLQKSCVVKEGIEEVRSTLVSLIVNTTCISADDRD
jgi:hypothetical protein